MDVWFWEDDKSPLSAVGFFDEERIMLKRNRSACIVMAIALALAAGCETARQHPRTTTGAGIGALTGAAAGALIDGSKGALVGAMFGALAGGGIGYYLDSKDKSAEQTVEAYDYTPDQGLEVVLAGVEAEPQIVAAGGDVILKVTYALMLPDADRVVQVRETRVVTLGGVEVARVAKDADRNSGTYSSEVQIALPLDAAPGTYTLTVTVTVLGESYAQSVTFTVQ
jgi:hypothetical protein